LKLQPRIAQRGYAATNDLSAKHAEERRPRKRSGQSSALVLASFDNEGFQLGQNRIFVSLIISCLESSLRKIVASFAAFNSGAPI